MVVVHLGLRVSRDLGIQDFRVLVGFALFGLEGLGMVETGEAVEG